MAESLPTLSAHLLREAQRFLIYPQRMRRTSTNVAAQDMIDDIRRQLIEWRKTFTPKKQEGQLKPFDKAEVLDEVYCRDFLKMIPEVVERTRRLSDISLAGISSIESLVYLREAANCYILGLPQAAIALARASVESHFRDKAARFLGVKFVAELDLKALIDEPRTAPLLSRNGKLLAHTVREAANRVLHEKPADSEKAFTVVEAARSVLVELSKAA